MTDRDDYKRLADRLELFWRILNTARKSDNPTVSVWASDTDLIAEAANVLRAASVKAGGVVAWHVEYEKKCPPGCISGGGGAAMFWGTTLTDYVEYARGLRARDDIETVTVTPLYTASPADARVREALEFYANEWLGSEGEGGKIEYEPTDRLIADHGDRADAALTAPGATTKSDVEALATTTVERPGTVTSEPEPSTSDPSSTRSDVTVDKLAKAIYYAAPFPDLGGPLRWGHLNQAIKDKHRTRARALLDQFEIRRK